MQHSFSKVYIREFAATVDIDLDQQMKVEEIGPDRTVRDVINTNTQRNQRSQVMDRLQAMEQEHKQLSINTLGQGNAYLAANKKYLTDAEPRPILRQPSAAPFGDTSPIDPFTLSGKNALQRAITGISEIDQYQSPPAKSQKQPSAVQFSRQATTIAMQRQGTLTSKNEELKAFQGTNQTNNMDFSLQTPGLGHKQSMQKSIMQSAGDEQNKEAIYGDNAVYLCFGDTIMLNYTQKVYGEEIAKQVMAEDPDYHDAESDNGFDKTENEALESKMHAKLSRVIYEPKYTYKGMVYSDGIIDRNLKIIPKKPLADTFNAKCQFQKCLFRIEIFDKCTFHEEYRKQEIKLSKMKEERDKVEDTGDYEQLAEIVADFPGEVRKLENLKQEMQKEKNSNKDVQKRLLGQKIQYGQPLLLNHVFTDEYLRVESSMLSDDPGFVQMQLGELSTLAKLNFIPSQDIQGFASELLIKNTGMTKFNLQIGGHVNLKDSFYVVNRDLGQMYYFHISPTTAAGSSADQSVLEINAGLEPTRLRAKLFLPALQHLDSIAVMLADQGQEMNKSVIYAGDTIRLLHQESNSYLQSQVKHVDVTKMFPPYPDFLVNQIRRLNRRKEKYSDMQEQPQQEEDSQDEQEGKTGDDLPTTIHLDLEKRKQSYANSCFEVQKVKSLHGGPICLNGVYRLKHNATEKYLSLDNVGKIEMTLKEDALTSVNSLICFRSMNQEQEMKNQDEYNITPEDDAPISSGTKIYIETYYKTYLQSFADIADETTAMFTYKDSSNHNYYTSTSSQTSIAVVAGHKQLSCEDGEPKMVFEIELVSQDLAKISFQAFSFMQAIEEYYTFLNNWGIGMLKGQIGSTDDLMFDRDLAVTTEDALRVQTDKLSSIVKQIKEMLLKALGQNREEFKLLQQQFTEIRFVEALAYLLDLIYYKTMPEEFREKAFKPDRHRHQYAEELIDEHEGQRIARILLDDINHEILEILMLLIRDNTENSDRLTRFTTTLKNQFIRADKELVLKIIRHMYKMAEYIHNDRASVILSEQGICQNLPDNYTKMQQVNRWLDLLETVTYKKAETENISKQIRYIKIITSFCKKKKYEEPVVAQQLQIMNRIIYYENNVPLWFGTQRATKRPFVSFAKFHQESDDLFKDVMNPALKECGESGSNVDGIKRFHTIFDMYFLTQQHKDQHEDLQIYFEYIAAVIDLYGVLCAGRNASVISAMRERIGLTNKVILSMIESDFRETNHFQAHPILKNAFLRLTKTLLLDFTPYNQMKDDGTSNHRCFFWKSIKNADPSRTIFGWEKVKYGEKLDGGQGISVAECEKTVRKIRQILIDYFQKGSNELQEFLYSAEKKTYTAKMVNPWLNDIIQHVTTAIAVIKSDNIDAYYIANLLEMIQQMLMGYSHKKVIEQDVTAKWVYRLTRVARQVPECQVKVAKLLTLCMEALTLVCRSRLSNQLLMFMKIFKHYVEVNDFSHVQYDANILDNKFKSIFQIMQFNIEVKSLNKSMIMAEPGKKVMLDQIQELALEKEMKDLLKENAMKIQHGEMKAPITERVSNLETPKMHGLMTSESAPPSPTGLSARPLLGNPSIQSAFDEDVNKDPNSYIKINLNVNNISLAENEETQAVQEENVNMIQKSYYEVEEVDKSVKESSLWKGKVPLEEFLLYFAFYETAYSHIPRMALDVMNQMATQRHQLFTEAMKIELIVSKQDEEIYEQIIHFKQRLIAMVARLTNDEITYLLFKIGKTDSLVANLKDTMQIIRQMIKLMSTNTGMEMKKIQNIIRQVNFDEILVNKFLKQLYYDNSAHRVLYQSVVDMLYWYTIENPTTQIQLKHHIPYLFHLMKQNLYTGHLLAQIVSSERLTDFGQKFIQFLVLKVEKESMFKSQIFKLLSVLALNVNSIQTVVLSQIIQNPKVHHKVYFSKNNNGRKIEHIKELVRKVMIQSSYKTYLMQTFPLDSSIEDIHEKIYLHLNLIDLINTCSYQNVYGVMQIRRIVDIDCLFDSILAQSVPFKMKTVYLRLLFNGFIQSIDSVQELYLFMDEKFLFVMKEIVLYDIENYYLYYKGLIIRQIDDENDPEQLDPGTKITRQKMCDDLSAQSKAQFDQLNESKNYRERLEEREKRQNLSPLNQGKHFDLFDQADPNEFWEYLCFFDREYGRTDGLILFIKDFYLHVSEFTDLWPDELISITTSLKSTLLALVDRLYYLQEDYAEHISNLDDFFFQLDEAINAIPDLNMLQNQAQNSQFVDDEFDNMTKEKIQRMIRDSIIQKSLTVRNRFDITSLSADVQVTPYFMKKKLKEICGSDATFKEISWIVRTLQTQTIQKIKLRSVLGIEVGQPGHVKTRYAANLQRSQQNKEVKGQGQQKILFNFKEFENLMKSELAKAGYKPLLMKLGEVYADKNFNMKMEEKELSISCRNDLQHFIKCYMEFMRKYNDADELNDMACKIMRTFNLIFVSGAQKSERDKVADVSLYEYRILRMYLRNFNKFFAYGSVFEAEKSGRDFFHFGAGAREFYRIASIKVFLIKLLTSMLKTLKPQLIEPQIRRITNRRRELLQNMFVDAGLLKAILEYVTSFEPMEVVDTVIEFIDQMCQGGNAFVLEKLYEFLLKQDDKFAFFKMLEQKIVHCYIHITAKAQTGNQNDQPVDAEGDTFVATIENRKRETNVIDAMKCEADVPFVQRNNDKVQPYYFPNDYSQEHQTTIQKPQSGLVLINLLKTIQRMMDVNLEKSESIGGAGFGQSKMQTLMKKQSQDSSKDVDLVKAVGNAFIEITVSLGQRIFQQITLVDVIEQLLTTLTMFTEGECAEIQLMLAKWDQLQHALAFFLDIDFNLFQVDRQIHRFKLRLLQQVLQLVLKTITHSDKQTETNLVQFVSNHINKQNLRNKLIDIFKFKLGGTDHKQHVYMTRKVCTHGIHKRRQRTSKCELNEYCFFEHLVPMDFVTLACGEDIFKILLLFNWRLTKEFLGQMSFDHQMTGWFFQKFGRTYKSQLNFESFDRLADQALRLKDTMAEDDQIRKEVHKEVFQKLATGSHEAEEKRISQAQEVNEMLNHLYVHYAINKYYDTEIKQGGDHRVQEYERDKLQGYDEKETNFIMKGIDVGEKIVIQDKYSKETRQEKAAAKMLSGNPYLSDELQTFEWDEVFLELLHENSRNRIKEFFQTMCCRTHNEKSVLKKFFRLICCFSWAAKTLKRDAIPSRTKNAQKLVEYRLLAQQQEELDKISDYFKKREQQIQKKRTYLGPFFGSFTREVLQDQIYVFDQFKYEAAFRFMMEQVAQVSIRLGDGSVRTEVFLIPGYCHFLTTKTKKDVLAMQSTYAQEGHTALMQALIEKLPEIRIEMKGQQYLESLSPAFKKIVQRWDSLNTISFWLTIIVNILTFVNYNKASLKAEIDIIMLRGSPAMLKTEDVTFLEFMADVLQLINSLCLFFCMSLYTLQFYGVHRYRIINRKVQLSVKQKKKVTAGSLNNRLERQKVEDKSTKFNPEGIEFDLVQGEDGLGLVEDRPTDLPGEPNREENMQRKQNIVAKLLHILSIVTREWIFDSMQAKNQIFSMVAICGMFVKIAYIPLLIMQMFFRISFLNQLFQLLVKNIGKLFLMLIMLLMLLQFQALVKLAISKEFDPTDHFTSSEERNIGLDTENLNIWDYSTSDLIDQYGERTISSDEQTTLFNAFQDVLISNIITTSPVSETEPENKVRAPGALQVLSWDSASSFIFQTTSSTTITIFALFLGLFIGSLLGMSGSTGGSSNQSCIVCGVSRTEFEALEPTSNWQKHLDEDHNVYAFIYYMLSCCEGDTMSKRRFSRLQKYVRVKLKRGDTSFIPTYHTTKKQSQQ